MKRWIDLDELRRDIAAEAKARAMAAGLEGVVVRVQIIPLGGPAALAAASRIPPEVLDDRWRQRAMLEGRSDADPIADIREIARHR
jgi:hypothetical protein